MLANAPSARTPFAGALRFWPRASRDPRW